MKLLKTTIEIAKQIDLLTYLERHSPHEIIRITPRECCTRTHDSLRISNGLWHWCSKGIGGRSALDYLIKVQNMGFVEAVNHLVGGFSKERIEHEGKAPQSVQTPNAVRELVIPAPFRNTDRAIAYLLSRGIDRSVITYCVQQGFLYESADYHNAVFVGKDENGTPRFAMQRGTMGSDFKGDVSGSDKRYSFHIAARQPSPELYVFEGAIDLLSQATLQMRQGDFAPRHRLALSGVSHRKDDEALPLALGHFLVGHQDVKTVFLCLDNDEADCEAARCIRAKLQNQYEIVNLFPPQGKDYNDYLRHLYPPIQLQARATEHQR